ncbi:MAG: DUF3179 domain-containing protein [Chloroflexi bacterium]|nr:DUF3179 domain-containing protein [Chloroflexota bacterium]
MTAIRWTVSLLGIALLASACSAAPLSASDGSEIASQKADLEVSAESLETPPAEIPPLPQHTTTADGTYGECDDPFKGSTPRFNPRSWETNFCLHSIDYDEILSGGPPRDGIPPIDSPIFESVTSADAWLDNREPVIALILDDDVRAYPIQVLTWHEIVNDKVTNLPIVVTFCPLCNTGLVFKRPTIDGETLTFGTSGNLRNSDLVMWDRQTESWWQQFSGEAIVGDLTGTKLTFLPSSIIAWGDFKDKYPGGQVLSTDTGYTRDYGRNPYAGYDNVDSNPFLFDGITDERLRPMERVIGILLDSGQGQAYTLQNLSEKRFIQDSLGETPFVIFWKAGTASALDSSNIASGNDIGAVGVYETKLDNEVLLFTANADGTFSDDNTGSTWDIFGQAIEGPLNGKSLTPITHHDTFWFAWAAFVSPDTLIE